MPPHRVGKNSIEFFCIRPDLPSPFAASPIPDVCTRARTHTHAHTHGHTQAHTHPHGFDGYDFGRYRHLCDSASSASAAMDVPVTAEPPPMRPAPRQPTPMISTEKHRMTPRIGELAMPVYIGTQKSEVVKDSEVTEV